MAPGIAKAEEVQKDVASGVLGWHEPARMGLIGARGGGEEAPDVESAHMERALARP